jgi:predicted O-methyltransferase YrrM
VPRAGTTGDTGRRYDLRMPASSVNTTDAEEPELVRQALARAQRRDFGYSCEDPVGPLLAALAAAVPPGGRILELGTGAGVGTAWLLSGLRERTDVTVRTVEQDPELAAEARYSGWPTWVEVFAGDAESVVRELGEHDLIFADAPGGKWTGLEHTLDAVSPGGVLVVDDMDTSRYPDPEHRAAVDRVWRTIADDRRFVSVAVPAGSGIVVATRTRG